MGIKTQFKKIFDKKTRVIILLILFDLSLATYLLLASPYQGKFTSGWQDFQNRAARQIYLLTHQPSFSNEILKSKLDPRPAHGGVSWADYNSDGLLDLLYPTPDGAKLYRNKGNETFEDFTQKSGLAGITGIFAGLFGDYDNDGCPDLYLSRNGFESKFPSLDSVGLPDLLYKNNCDGTFSNRTEEAGIADLYHGEGASWVDYNNDGFLDIYVVNIGRWQNMDNWAQEPNLLYKNNGDGTFSEVSKYVGISGYAVCPNFDALNIDQNKLPIRGRWKISFQPVWFDYNNDNRPDLFIATDAGISPLYVNLGNGQFRDTTEESGLCKDGSGMGATVGDFNNDGYLDLYVTNNGQNYLWENNNGQTFNEISKESGVSYQGTLGWGTGFLDYDNDGYLDLYTVSGALTQEDVSYRGEKLLDKLFKNVGNSKFSDVSLEEGIKGAYPKLSGAVGDYNNDGFVDIVVIPNSKVPSFAKFGSKLYQNRPGGNNWLTVQLRGTISNRDGVGARITLKSGPSTQYREVNAGSSYLSQNSLWQTFGIGKNTSIDELTVSWPSGINQNLGRVKINQKILITETK